MRETESERESEKGRQRERERNRQTPGGKRNKKSETIERIQEKQRSKRYAIL